jgi:hypothetical protein
LLVKGLGLSIFALGFVNQCQIVQGLSCIGMAFPKCFFIYFQLSLEKEFGFSISALGSISTSQ